MVIMFVFHSKNNVNVFHIISYVGQYNWGWHTTSIYTYMYMYLEKGWRQGPCLLPFTIFLPRGFYDISLCFFSISLFFLFFLWWKECARVGEGVDMLPCRVVVSFCFYYKSVTTLCSNILFDKGYNKNDYMLIRKHFLFSLSVIRNISNLQKYSLFLFFVFNIAKKDLIFCGGGMAGDINLLINIEEVMERSQVYEWERGQQTPFQLYKIELWSWWSKKIKTFYKF